MGLARKLGAASSQRAAESSPSVTVPYKWSTQTYTVQEVLERFKLPCVVQCVTDSCTLLWSDFKFDMRQPLLFYSKRSVQKVHAVSVQLKNETLEEFGPPMAIPQDFDGWFGAAPKGVSKVRQLQSENLADSTAQRILMIKNCPSFLVYRASDGSWTNKPHQISAGEVLRRLRLVDASTKDVRNCVELLKKHGPCLECMDEKDDLILLPLSHSVTAYDVAHHYPGDETGVFQTSALIEAGNSKLPRVLTVVHGNPPLLAYAFTGLIRCYSVFTEDTLLAATLDDPSSRCLELITDSCVRFRLALNEVAVKKTCEYSNAFQICEKFGAKFVTGIKVSFTLKLEAPSSPSIDFSNADSVSDMQEVEANSEFDIEWTSKKQSENETNVKSESNEMNGHSESSTADVKEFVQEISTNGKLPSLDLRRRSDEDNNKNSSESNSPKFSTSGSDNSISTSSMASSISSSRSSRQREEPAVAQHRDELERQVVRRMIQKGLMGPATDVDDLSSSPPADLAEERVTDNPLFYFFQRNPTKNPLQAPGSPEKEEPGAPLSGQTSELSLLSGVQLSNDEEQRLDLSLSTSTHLLALPGTAEIKNPFAYLFKPPNELNEHRGSPNQPKDHRSLSDQLNDHIDNPNELNDHRGSPSHLNDHEVGPDQLNYNGVNPNKLNDHGVSPNKGVEPTQESSHRNVTPQSDKASLKITSGQTEEASFSNNEAVSTRVAFNQRPDLCMPWGRRHINAGMLTPISENSQSPLSSPSVIDLSHYDHVIRKAAMVYTESDSSEDDDDTDNESNNTDVVGDANDTEGLDKDTPSGPNFDRGNEIINYCSESDDTVSELALLQESIIQRGVSSRYSSGRAVVKNDSIANFGECCELEQGNLASLIPAGNLQPEVKGLASSSHISDQRVSLAEQGPLPGSDDEDEAVYELLSLAETETSKVNTLTSSNSLSSPSNTLTSSNSLPSPSSSLRLHYSKESVQRPQSQHKYPSQLSNSSFNKARDKLGFGTPTQHSSLEKIKHVSLFLQDSIFPVEKMLEASEGSEFSSIVSNKFVTKNGYTLPESNGSSETGSLLGDDIASPLIMSKNQPRSNTVFKVNNPNVPTNHAHDEQMKGTAMHSTFSGSSIDGKPIRRKLEKTKAVTARRLPASKISEPSISSIFSVTAEPRQRFGSSHTDPNQSASRQRDSIEIEDTDSDISSVSTFDNDQKHLYPYKGQRILSLTRGQHMTTVPSFERYRTGSESFSSSQSSGLNDSFTYGHRRLVVISDNNMVFEDNTPRFQEQDSQRTTTARWERQHASHLFPAMVGEASSGCGFYEQSSGKENYALYGGRNHEPSPAPTSSTFVQFTFQNDEFKEDFV